MGVDILDILAENLKAESVRHYVRDMFDRHVTPNSWEERVEIVSQLLDRCAAEFSASIDTNQPERYAQDYQELIRVYVQSLETTSSVFRRL